MGTVSFTLPHSIELEKELLGALLRRAIEKREGVDTLPLAPEDFHITTHQQLFNAMLRVSERGEAPDLVNLDSELGDDSKAERLRELMVEVLEAQPTGANRDALIKKVRELAAMRRAVDGAVRFVQRVTDSPGTASDELSVLHERIELEMAAVSDGRVEKDELLRDLLSRLDREERGETCISTGLTKLDSALGGGWCDGGYYLLGGRPGMGKSALAIFCAMRAGWFLNLPVLFVSLEVTPVEIVRDFLSCFSEVDCRNPAARGLNREAVEAAEATFRDARIEVWAPRVPVLGEIEAKIRSARRHGARFVIVDYLQLISWGREASRRWATRNEEVAHISHTFRRLVNELGVPILAISQLSRHVAREHRAEMRRPTLIDLRDSGALEQDADVVLLLHRENYYEVEGEDSPTGELEIIVAKNRWGPRTTVEVHYNFRTKRFV